MVGIGVGLVPELAGHDEQDVNNENENDLFVAVGRAPVFVVGCCWIVIIDHLSSYL